MRNRMRIVSRWSLIALFVLSIAASTAEAKIEAVKGKTYNLTKEHGPWMIMVTSVRGETKEQNELAIKAANDLVFELRKKGIPAYVYGQDAVVEHIEIRDRMGREDRRVYAAQRNMIGVLAGNYSSVDDKTAQNTLKFIKKFQPKTKFEGGFGLANVVVGPPFAKSFLTINPMLSQEEIARKNNKDPVLLELNSGSEYSLAECKGKYSVIVASFYGKSAVKPKKFGEFDSNPKTKRSLDHAYQDCWELVMTMRAQNHEAYIFHDRYRSIVTVGSFNSPDDPRIDALKMKFSAKYKKNQETKEDVLVSECVKIPGARDNDPPQKIWVMDPYPQVIEVPRLR